MDPIITSFTYRDGVALISVGGEIDLSTAPAFEAAIAGALGDDPPVLVIELSDVKFMASVGLRILAATHEKVSKTARVAIVASNPATSRPMQLTGLDKLLPVYQTLDDALSAVATEPNG